MSTSRDAEPQTEASWKLFINKYRNGAAYFEAQECILFANPTGYFEHRCMTTRNKNGILDEWRSWMDAFSTSRSQVLRDLAGKRHTPQADAAMYLTSAALVDRKVELVEINKDQLNQVGHEMTEMLRTGEFLSLFLHLSILSIHILLTFLFHCSRSPDSIHRYGSCTTSTRFNA
jgi:hypothetical protein